MIKMYTVPPSHRFIEVLSVGLLFGDVNQLTCPSDDWTSFAGAARFVSKRSENWIGFRRFVYDPEEGKKYMDSGWVYFKGTKISKKDILNGRAEKMYPGIEISDILKQNVKDNGFDLIWFSDSNKFYPFEENDSFVRL